MSDIDPGTPANGGLSALTARPGYPFTLDHVVDVLGKFDVSLLGQAGGLPPDYLQHVCRAAAYYMRSMQHALTPLADQNVDSMFGSPRSTLTPENIYQARKALGR